MSNEKKLMLCFCDQIIQKISTKKILEYSDDFMNRKIILMPFLFTLANIHIYICLIKFKLMAFNQCLWLALMLLKTNQVARVEVEVYEEVSSCKVELQDLIVSIEK